MKKHFLPCLAAGILSAGLLSSSALAAADSGESNGLNVSIQTDKDSYTKGETVQTSLVIKNDSSYTFRDISYTISFPQGITAEDNQELSGNLTALSADASKTYTVTAALNNTSGENTPAETTAAPGTESAATSGNGDSKNTADNVDTGDAAPIAILCAIAAVSIALFLFSSRRRKKDMGALLLVCCLGISGIYTEPAQAAVPVNNNFSVTVSKTILVDNASLTITADVTVGTETITTIGIHDPSVFQDPVSGEFYSYGSHIIAGNSDDLVSWKYTSGASAGYGTSNRLFEHHYLEEFSEVYDWLGADVKEGIWALDVTYSEAAAKAGNDPYLMYVTVCNGGFKSAICLATSDSPAGPFSYKDMIVCSDYRQSEVENGHTNLLEVLGVDKVSEMTADQKALYFTADSGAYKASLPDCIDPAPFFDGEGNLYMTYGSFTCKGGIRVLKMDAATGLRSADTYAYAADNSQDPYYGKKIANANGEGPYILKVASEASSTGYYYFLFWSQGNLRSTGGYNMRMFRSEYPDGGYVDYMGQSALDSISATNLGVRIIDGFLFTSMKYPSTANGGNSAIVTQDGKMFLHYHSKSSDAAAYGENGFVIKSNQMFLNDEGWLVTTPYSYGGETMSNLTAGDVAGDYEFIYHRLAYYKDPVNAKDNYVSSEMITLEEDGTITGAYTGNWTLSGNYLNLTIDGKEYHGVALKQYDESSDRTETIVFTAEGSDNRTVWGSKIYYSDSERSELDLEQLFIAATAEEDFSLTRTGLLGSSIAWTSDNPAIVIENDTAKVVPQDFDQTVTLTATSTYGEASTSVIYEVTVPAEKFQIPSTISTSTIDLPEYTAAGKKISWTSSDPSVINTETLTVVVPADSSKQVTLTGTIEGSDRIITAVITVMPLPSTVVYSEDYDALDSIDAAAASNLWYSANAADSVTLQTDGTNKYVQFAPGRANSRGAISTFPDKGQTSGIYMLDFDLALTAGDNQTTEFAVTTQNMSYSSNNMNNGIAGGYLFKLSANNSDTWSVNDSDTLTIEKGTWVHVNVLADTVSGNASITITDEDNELYSGTVAMNNAGALKGFYIRGGRYDSVTCVDNIVLKQN